MNVKRDRAYWEQKYDEKIHMPSFSGAAFGKNAYVDYCLLNYSSEVEKEK